MSIRTTGRRHLCHPQYAALRSQAASPICCCQSSRQGRLSNTINREELMTMRAHRRHCGRALRAARCPHTGSSAAISEPHRHHHRPLPGRRPDRSDRARGRAIAVARSSSKALSSRTSAAAIPSGLREGRACRARRLHADPAQSADFGERDAVQEAAVRHREGFHAGHADQPQSAGAGRPQHAARQQSQGTDRADEEADAESRDPRLRRHRPSCHRAVRARGRREGRHDPVSRRLRRPLTDLLGGQVDLFFATPQSVVQMVNSGS